METIFAWLGVTIILLFAIWLVVGTIGVVRKNWLREHTNKLKEKLELYEELADDIDTQVKIIMNDDWAGYYRRGYNFEKLCKEMIELREFKKKYDKVEGDE